MKEKERKRGKKWQGGREANMEKETENEKERKWENGEYGRKGRGGKRGETEKGVGNDRNGKGKERRNENPIRFKHTHVECYTP